jgi:pyruvate dehydrogenase E1 component beta subunit
VPLVVREPIGMWRSSAAQHSQSLEAWYAHIPGLVVVTPATPADNCALLKAAIRCDDPVVYMEHKNLWGLRSEVPDGEEVGELGRARLVREGGDITLVSWSAMVHEAAKAVELAADEGIAVELIDLRTLWPWDEEAVLASVGKTGRLLVVHEAVSVAGFGSEIAATVVEELFDQLEAPVRRLGAPRVPIGYAPSLEDQVKILAQRDILPAIRALVGKQR